MSDKKSTESKTPMTPEAAARIQSHADSTGTNQDFKSRAQRAAEKGGASGEGRVARDKKE